MVYWLYFNKVLKCLNFSGRSADLGGEGHTNTTFTCDEQGYGQCSQTCSGQYCEQTCNKEQGTCSLNCKGRKCTQTCSKGTCDLECNGRHCRQICFQDCNLKCLRGRCKQRCRGLDEQGSCRVHCPVAGRPSKCQQNCQSKESQCTKNFVTITAAPTWPGKRSNESAIALTGPALKREEGRRREAPSSFLPFLLPILLTFANPGAFLDQSWETYDNVNRVN